MERPALHQFQSDVHRPYPAASVSLRVAFLQLLACILLFVPAKLYVFRALVPSPDQFVASLAVPDRVLLARALLYEGLTLVLAFETAFLLTMYVLPAGRITLRRAAAFTWGGVFFLVSAYQLLAFLHWQRFFTYPSWVELRLSGGNTGPLVASLGRLLDDRPFATLFVLFAITHAAALYAALRSSKPLSFGEVRAWIAISGIIGGFALSGWVGPKFPLPWTVTTHPLVALLYPEARLGAPKVMKLAPAEEPCPQSSVAAPLPAVPWPRRERLADRPDVVVMFWESAPARRVYPWNADRSLTPRLAALEDRICFLENVYSNGSLSFPARFAFLFGQYCPMAVQNWGIRPVDFSVPRQFARAGYRTLAIGSNNMAFSGTRQMLGQAGIDRIEDPGTHGADYLPHVWGVDDRMLFDRLKVALDQKRDWPLFAIALTSSTHHPYQALPPSVAPASTDEADLHAAGMKFDDALLGDLVAWMDRRTSTRPVLLLVVGDHGEGFGEHPDKRAHGNSLHEEATHVACFIVNRQRFGLPARIPSLGSIVDLAPTVLELTGLPVPEEYQGRSLAKSPPGGRAISYLPYLDCRLALRDGSWTLIAGLDPAVNQLYDARTDPLEQTDVAARNPGVVACMRRELAGWLERQNPVWRRWVE